jgi:HEAT repeat protein
MKNRAAVGPIIERLKADKMDSVRAAAAVALGQIGDQAAVVALVEVLSHPGSNQSRSRKRRTKENEFILRAVTHSLGEIGSPAAVPALIDALADDSLAGDVSREAAHALGLIGDASAIPALRAAVAASDPYLSRTASAAIRKIDAGRRPS